MKEKFEKRLVWKSQLVREIYKARIGAKLFDIQYYSLCSLIYKHDRSIRQIHENKELGFSIFEITRDDLFFCALYCHNTKRIASFWKHEDNIDIHAEFMAYINSLYFVTDAQQDIKSKEKIGKMTAIRNRLFLKDPICGICGLRILQIEQANIDHIIPRSKGGKNSKKNLQLAHIRCNHKKADTHLK